MPVVSAPAYNYVSNAGAVDGVCTLNVATTQVRILVHRLKVLRTAGAASANFFPRLDEASGLAAGTMQQGYKSSTATASAVLHDRTGLNSPMYTDASGNIYAHADPDVPLDTFVTGVWYQVIL